MILLWIAPEMVRGQRRAVRGARTASVHWQQVPLGEGLKRLGETYQTAVFLDRRIDPNRELTLETQNLDLAESLQRAAAAVEGLGACQIGAAWYVGPKQTAESLRTVVALREEEIATLPAAGRAAFTVRRTIKWPRLAEPRQLIEDSVSQRGWQVVGGERIPHDLWAVGELPAMPLVEQLTILLAGFDLTFTLHGERSAVEIVSLPDAPPMISRKYRLRYAADQLESLQRQFPAIAMRATGDELVADARIEDHQRLAESLAGAPRDAKSGAAGPGRQVYSLRVQEQPVRALVGALAQRMNWMVEIDEAAIRAAGRSLEQRVSFDVKDVSQEDLLRAMLGPAGLAFRLEGNRLRIEVEKK